METEVESIAETGASTAKDVTKPVSVLALMDHAATIAQQTGPRPQFRAPSLRSDELGRPSLSLQSGNITGLADYDDSTKDDVAEALTAMDTLHQGVEKIIAAREASKRNPAWTEASQVIMTAQLADKVSEQASKATDAALRLMNARIKNIEGQLRQPLDASLASPVSAEIRSHLKGLSTTKRGELMQELIAKGDVKSLGAALSAPGFLTGLSDAQIEAFTEMHNRKQNPMLTKRLSLLRAATEKLANAGSLFLVQAERAQGVQAHIVAKLKAAQSKAESAFR